MKCIFGPIHRTRPSSSSPSIYNLVLMLPRLNQSEFLPVYVYAFMAGWLAGRWNKLKMIDHVSYSRPCSDSHFIISVGIYFRGLVSISSGLGHITVIILNRSLRRNIDPNCRVWIPFVHILCILKCFAISDVKLKREPVEQIPGRVKGSKQQVSVL